MNNSNKDYADIFDQDVHSSYINKLFWIAGQNESDELKDLIQDLDEDIWKDMMPDLFKSEFFYDYFNDGEMLDMLLGNHKFGFIAEVDHPDHRGFVKNKDGKVVGSHVVRGHCEVSYVYGETVDDLVSKIKEVSEKSYQEMIERDKTE